MCRGLLALLEEMWQNAQNCIDLYSTNEYMYKASGQT